MTVNYLASISKEIDNAISNSSRTLAAKMFTPQGVYIAVNGEIVHYDGCYLYLNSGLYVDNNWNNIDRYLRDAIYKGEL